MRFLFLILFTSHLIASNKIFTYDINTFSPQSLSIKLTPKKKGQLLFLSKKTVHPLINHYPEAGMDLNQLNISSPCFISCTLTDVKENISLNSNKVEDRTRLNISIKNKHKEELYSYSISLFEIVRFTDPIKIEDDNIQFTMNGSTLVRGKHIQERMTITLSNEITLQKRFPKLLQEERWSWKYFDTIPSKKEVIK